jgi:hypothetical protein
MWLLELTTFIFSERRLTQTHERSRLLPEQSLRISGASLHNIRASFRTVMFPGLGYGTVTSSPYPSDRKHIVVIDVEANISSPLPVSECYCLNESPSHHIIL